VQGASGWPNRDVPGGLSYKRTLRNLQKNTTYEYKMRAYYTDGTKGDWTGIETFTTIDGCTAPANIHLTLLSTDRAYIAWDTAGISNKVKIRIKEVVSGNQVCNQFVALPINIKRKFGLSPNTAYVADMKTFCNDGTYRSAWSSPLYFTTFQGARLEGATAIEGMIVYPNPSRSIFNINFTSDEVQSIKVNIVDMMGQVVISEDLGDFVGEYHKQFDLSTYSKGVYFMNIQTNTELINQKLMLQ